MSFDLGYGREFVGVLRPSGYAKKTHAIYKMSSRLPFADYLVRSYYGDLCGSARWYDRTFIESMTDRGGQPIEVDCKLCRKAIEKFAPEQLFRLSNPDWEV